MSKLRISATLVLIAILALSVMSISVWAKNDASDAISATLRLNTATKIGSTLLPAGEYKVVVDGTQAKFQKGGKVVAEVPCTVKDISFTPQTTSFVISRESISEIQVSGKNKAIEFSSGQ